MGAIGCASSTELENQARIHTLRADAAASTRDYSVAAEEKHEAQRLHAKAVEKAYKEGRTLDVAVPADVPASPTP
ncbi:MAG TPA: hypothetical protein VF945_02020 [Polyangia bacterium]